MRYAVVVVAAIFAIVFVLGVLYFPDAPIRVCGDGYCGKYGAIHPRAMYDNYLWWTRAVLGSFALTFVGTAVLVVRESGQSPD